MDLRWQTERAQARRDVTNLSVALAEQVSRLIEGADQVMRLIQADFNDDPKAFDVTTWWNRATSLNQIAIFYETGAYVSSRTPPVPGAQPVNVADRAYFRHLATHPEAGLYVPRTIRGRILGA